jgi:hypothetical protein
VIQRENPEDLERIFGTVMKTHASYKKILEAEGGNNLKSV